MTDQAERFLLAAELETLKTQLADSAARSDIECATNRTDDGWHDLATAEPEDEEYLRTAMRYLALRGLLQTHPENAKWVRVVHPADAAEACQGLTCGCNDPVPGFDDLDPEIHAGGRG